MIEPAASIISRMVEIVGAAHVSDASRNPHTYEPLRPIAIVWPDSVMSVARLMKLCQRHQLGMAVVGSGTRALKDWVVPPNTDQPLILLDMRRMSNILEMDSYSQVIRCQAGVLLGHIEESLIHRSLTLGPYPEYVFQSTLGGFLNLPHPAAESPATGKLVDACLGLTLVDPQGQIIRTKIAPRRATGPDFTRGVIESRGGLGVIVEAALRIYQKPADIFPMVYAFDSLKNACLVIQSVLERGIRPWCLKILSASLAQRTLPICASHASAPIFLLAGFANHPHIQKTEVIFLDTQCQRNRAIQLSPENAIEWFRQCHGNFSKDERAIRLSSGYGLLHSEIETLTQTLSLEKLGLRFLMDGFSLQRGTLWIDPSDPEAENVRTHLSTYSIAAFPFPPSKFLQRWQTLRNPERTLFAIEK